MPTLLLLAAPFLTVVSAADHTEWDIQAALLLSLSLQTNQVQAERLPPARIPVAPRTSTPTVTPSPTKATQAKTAAPHVTATPEPTFPEISRAATFPPVGTVIGPAVGTFYAGPVCSGGSCSSMPVYGMPLPGTVRMAYPSVSGSVVLPQGSYTYANSLPVINGNSAGYAAPGYAPSYTSSTGGISTLGTWGGFSSPTCVGGSCRSGR